PVRLLDGVLKAEPARLALDAYLRPDRQIAAVDLVFIPPSPVRARVYPVRLGHTLSTATATLPDRLTDVHESTGGRYDQSRKAATGVSPIQNVRSLLSSMRQVWASTKTAPLGVTTR